MTIGTSNAQAVYCGSTIIGKIEGGAFTKPVSGSKHMLKRPPAWAIQADTYDSQVKGKVKYIVIWDKDTGRRYKTSAEIFDKHKGVLDRGFGKQYFLTMNHWTVL